MVAPGRKLKGVEAGKGALSFLTSLGLQESVSGQARPQLLEAFTNDFIGTLPFYLPLPAVAL